MIETVMKHSSALRIDREEDGRVSVYVNGERVKGLVEANIKIAPYKPYLILEMTTTVGETDIDIKETSRTL